MASSSKKLQRSGDVRFAEFANSPPTVAEIHGVPWARSVLFHLLAEEVGMAELAERVARLEERFDGVQAAIADVKAAVSKLDDHVVELRSEMRSEFSALRRDFGSELSTVRGESSGIRAEMNTQFRWLMGGIGTAALAILVAVLAAILAKG